MIHDLIAEANEHMRLAIEHDAVMEDPGADGQWAFQNRFLNMRLTDRGEKLIADKEACMMCMEDYDSENVQPQAACCGHVACGLCWDLWL